MNAFCHPMKFHKFRMPNEMQMTYNWIIMAKIWRGFSAHMMTCIFSQFFFLFPHFGDFWQDIFSGNFLDWFSKKMIGNFVVVVVEKGWVDTHQEEAKCQRKNKKFCHFWQFVKFFFFFQDYPEGSNQVIDHQLFFERKFYLKRNSRAWQDKNIFKKRDKQLR